MTRWKSTASKLILLAGFSGVLLLIAVLLASDTPIGERLDCDRSTDTCRFERRLLTGTRISTAPLSAMSRAEVHVGSPRRGRATARITLDLAGPAGLYYVADFGPLERAAAEREAKRINDFLGHNSEARLVFDRDDRPRYWIAFGLFMAVIPLVALLAFVLFRSDSGKS
jgi:hypothetical protein